MFYKTVIFEQNYQTAFETFLSSKFGCVWFLILHASIRSLKEPRVVAMESFLIEFIEAIVHKNFKTKCFWNIWGTYK